MSKKQYALVTFPLVIFFLILFFASKMQFSRKQIEPTIFPTPTLIPQPTSLPHPLPPVFYKQGSLDKVENKLGQHIPLSSSDESIRSNLIEIAAKNNGIIYSTNTFFLAYIVGPNDFEVQILTTDVKAAKKDALSFLKAQGVSQDGLCNFPIIFYLDEKVARELQNQNVIFNPLPEGC